MATLDIPLIPNEKTIAIVYDNDGAIVDECFTYEAGQAYALHEGLYVLAVQDDGVYWTVERQQALYDAERERHADCWNKKLPQAY